MQMLLLALMLALFVHDQFGTERLWLGRGWLAVLWVGLPAALGLAYAGMCLWTRRRLETRGGALALSRFERASAGWRLLLLGQYLAVLAAGGLTLLRRTAGDRVVVDEVLFLLPTLAAIVGAWWSYYPIDARLRGMALAARLDAGLPARPVWTRGEYLLAQARHQLSLFLVPLLLIMAWIEGVAAVVRPGHSFHGVEMIEIVTGLGALAILLLTPLLIRHIWDTAPLPEGQQRSRLLAMCRQYRVRVRQLLVWRTFGCVVNGAVMGLVAPVRYILLTDALLEALPADHIDAVMAHELAHVRKHHLFWLLLAASVLSAAPLTLAWLGLAGWRALAPQVLPHDALRALTPLEDWLASPANFTAATMALVVPAWLGAFGWVSRRFERQADTFAVQHLARRTDPDRPGDPPRPTIDPRSALVMAQALQAVADLNNIAVDRRDWRHGSIASRQAYLGRLVGQPLEAPAIDREIRLIKAATLALWVVLAVAAILAPRSVAWFA